MFGWLAPAPTPTTAYAPVKLNKGYKLISMERLRGSGAGKDTHASNVHYPSLCNDKSPSGDFQDSAARKQTRARVRGWELDGQT